MCPHCRKKNINVVLKKHTCLHICTWCGCLFPNLSDLTKDIETNPKIALEAIRKATIEYHKEKFEDFYCG